MPNIVVEGPVIDDIEKKRELVKRITDAVADVFGIDKSHITVTIKENKPDNVGVGGLLISDIRKMRE